MSLGQFLTRRAGTVVSCLQIRRDFVIDIMWPTWQCAHQIQFRIGFSEGHKAMRMDAHYFLPCTVTTKVSCDQGHKVIQMQDLGT